MTPSLPAAPGCGGRLSVIGLGPGDAGLLAPDAAAALQCAKTVIGYSGYVALLAPAHLAGKEVIATGMRAEVDRCEKAIAAALAGKEVCLVCSGDPGVYAMAGLVMEILHARALTLAHLDLTIIPGIPAVCAAAALLGAPLTHDFACVSLSDLLTPAETIESRLDHAFAADFVVALYNPRSRNRKEALARALAIALRHREGTTPLGHVQNAFRPAQRVTLAPLAHFDPEEADMFSIILVGNSRTAFLPAPDASPTNWLHGARMYTPRGYGSKYSLN